MAAFSEQELLKKIKELNNTQQSIQGTSGWILKFSNESKIIVKYWFKEFRKVSPKKKLMYMYLANDVIQNGRKKTPDFLKAFQAVLPTAFKDAAKVPDTKTKEGMGRLLNIWEERAIYPAEFIQHLKSVSTNVWEKEESRRNRHGAKGGSEDGGSLDEASLKSEPHHHHHHKHTPESQSSSTVVQERNGKEEAETLSTEPADQGQGSPPFKRPRVMSLREELEMQLQKDRTEPPGTGELLKSLEDLQNAASADAKTRRTIASFPTEVADVQAVQQIKSKQQCSRLLEQVDASDSILVEYNERLENEMVERKRVALMLRTYLLHQPDRMEESQRKVQECRDKLVRANQLRQQLESHISKLPDLSLLPDVTRGLDPLPSVGDLFS